MTNDQSASARNPGIDLAVADGGERPIVLLRTAARRVAVAGAPQAGEPLSSSLSSTAYSNPTAGCDRIEPVPPKLFGTMLSRPPWQRRSSAAGTGSRRPCRRPMRYAALATPNFSDAILVPSTRDVIFWKAISRAMSGEPCFGFRSMLRARSRSRPLSRAAVLGCISTRAADRRKLLAASRRAGSVDWSRR